MSNNNKRFIKLVVSLIVFIIDSFIILILRLFNKTKARHVILYYHAVYSEEKKAFALQMDDLLRWTKPICINDIDKMKTGLRYSAITFDDGFTCVLDNALPEPSKRNIPATLFVPSDCLGQRPPWLNEAHVDHKNVVMTQAQLKSLDKKLVLIGSHCRTHPNLLQISKDEARKEIFQSKKELEDILNTPIEAISFPEGDFDQTHIDMAVQAGYRQAYSILPELIHAGSDGFVRGRVKVDPSDWRMEYRLKLLGAYRWLPAAFALKRRLHVCFK
jgi:peptidoglycan/xylan/chitin deacetylase (PgdA/CDA1 family)